MGLRFGYVVVVALLACGAPAAPAERPVTIVSPPAHVAPSEPPPPPLARTFLDWRPGADETELRRAADEVVADAKSGARVDRRVADALWACFLRYAPSKTNSIRGTQAIHDAILAVREPSYGDKAIAALAAPAVAEGSGRVNDQLDFWQTTAIQVLKDLRYARAAHALVRVLVTNTKRGLAALAVAALQRVPAAAVPVLASALDGSDPELARLEADWGADAGWMPGVLEALGQTTLEPAKAAILGAMPRATTDANRIAVVQALVYFPSTREAVAAAKTICASLAPDSNERATLLSLAGDLFDPSFATWALREAATARGALRFSGMVGAIQGATKVMGPAETSAVARALATLAADKTIPPDEKKQALAMLRAMQKTASDGLAACGRKVACCVTLLDKPVGSGPVAGFEAVKAATMAGMLGDARTRKELVARVAKITNAWARLSLALAIDHLAPSGDADDAAALERIVEDDTARHDTDALRSDDALTRVAWMLRARL